MRVLHTILRLVEQFAPWLLAWRSARRLSKEESRRKAAETNVETRNAMDAHVPAPDAATARERLRSRDPASR